jgi:hypothetical protein
MKVVDGSPHVRRVMRLDPTDRLGSGKLSIAGRSRLATASDVRAIDADRIAVISLVGQTLTVGRWSNVLRRYRREHVIRTRNQDGHASCDLLDFDGTGMLLTSDCTPGSVSLYTVLSGPPRYVRSLVPATGSRGYCHGAAFVPGITPLVAFAYSHGLLELVVVDLDDGRERATFAMPGWKPKSITVDGQGRLVVPFCDGAPRVGAESSFYSSRILRLRLDVQSGTLVPDDEISLPGVHVDATVVVGDAILFNNQTDDSIDVIEEGPSGLRLTRRVTGFSFPHSAALSWDREHVLVAQYGDHSIVRVPLAIVLG